MEKFIRQSLKILSMLVAALLVGVNANADIMIYTGVEGGSGDVENVLFDNFSNQEGTTVKGIVTQGHIDYVVNFTSDERLITPSQGQARIEASSGSFDYLEIAMEDSDLGFNKIQFNIDAAEDGDVKLTFFDLFDNLLSDGTYELKKNGQNFFTAIAEGDPVIGKAIINSYGGLAAISDVQQIRIGPAETNDGPDHKADPAPEPATMLLFGSGLVGLAGLCRKFRKG